MADSGDQLLIPVNIRPALLKLELDQNAQFFVEVSSKKTRQTVRIPIRRLVLDPKCDESVDPSWTSVIGFFIGHYETVVVAIICVFATWIYAVKKSSAPPPSG